MTYNVLPVGESTEGLYYIYLTFGIFTVIVKKHNFSCTRILCFQRSFGRTFRLGHQLMVASLKEKPKFVLLLVCIYLGNDLCAECQECWPVCR